MKLLFQSQCILMATTANSEHRVYTAAQVAGISVGSSIGALILSFAVFLSFYRRKKSKLKAPRKPGSESHWLAPETGPTHTSPAQKITQPTSLSIAEVTHLPRRIYDDELGLQASILKTSITNFVYNYYEKMPAKDVKRTDLSTGLSERHLETVLQSQRHRPLIVRQYLAQQLIASVFPFCEPELALLPTAWVDLLRSSNLHTTGTSGKIYTYPCSADTHKESQPIQNTDFETAPETFPSRSRRLWYLSLWGSVTTAMLQPPMEPSEDAVSPVARRIAEKMERTFPYGPPEVDVNRRNRALVYLASLAAKLAIALFSQLDACDFLWLPADEVEAGGVMSDRTEPSSHNRLIVYPTLRRRSLEVDGTFGEPVIVYGAEVEAEIEAIKD